MSPTRCGECGHGRINPTETDAGECLACGADVSACASGDCPDEGAHWWVLCPICAACPNCGCGCEYQEMSE